MPKLAYLDSARMGLMCERARLAHTDYVRLAGLEGCSLYFEQLLRKGFDVWPTHLRQQFPGLCDWRGPRELKAAFLRLVGQPSGTPVLLANRSTQLMQLAARVLATTCRRILLTDLTWPSYRRILETERQAGRLGVTTVALADDVLYGQASVEDVVALIAERYELMRCDAVVLPAVSHLGIRLPVDLILQTLKKIHESRFIVVDGAQALGHVPDELGLQHCDLFVGGCHKWLRGHFPMGVAFCPSQLAKTKIRSIARSMAFAGDLDDPLLHFVAEVEGKVTARFGETVNLASLFATRAALIDGSPNPVEVAVRFDVRRENAARLAATMRDTLWRPVLPRREFRTGILLLQLQAPRAAQLSPQQLRDCCLSSGLAVTTYEHGLVRLSMPHRAWTDGELDALHRALCHVAEKSNSSDVSVQEPPWVAPVI